MKKDTFDINRQGQWTRDQVIAMDEKFKQAMLAAPNAHRRRK